MNILAEIEKLINEFNLTNNENLDVDSIRIEFSKQYKLEQLQEVGNWKKINKNDKRIIDKLKRRLDTDEITSVYQLEQHNIYYYNSNKDKPKYRKAVMVIFGLKQYHKSPAPQHIVRMILSILKNVSSLDICKDFLYKPSLQQIKQHFYLKRYVEPRTRTPTETYYINNTGLSMIEKFTIYNKQIKNNLNFTCWRIEALITIPNSKFLALPLQEFKQVSNLMGVQSND